MSFKYPPMGGKSEVAKMIAYASTPTGRDTTDPRMQTISETAPIRPQAAWLDVDYSSIERNIEQLLTGPLLPSDFDMRIYRAQLGETPDLKIRDLGPVAGPLGRPQRNKAKAKAQKQARKKNRK